KPSDAPVSCGPTSCCWISASAARADSRWRDSFRQPGRQRAHPTTTRGLSSSRHTLNRTSDVSSRRVPRLDSSPNLPCRPEPSENCSNAEAELAGLEPSENCQDTAVIVRAPGKPQLGEDVLDVFLNGSLGNPQCAGNSDVGPPLGHQ